MDGRSRAYFWKNNFLNFLNIQEKFLKFFEFLEISYKNFFLPYMYASINLHLQSCIRLSPIYGKYQKHVKCEGDATSDIGERL